MRQRASLPFQTTTKSLVFAKLHGAIVNVGKPPASLPWSNILDDTYHARSLLSIMLYAKLIQPAKPDPDQYSTAPCKPARHILDVVVFLNGWLYGYRVGALPSSLISAGGSFGLESTEHPRSHLNI